MRRLPYKRLLSHLLQLWDARLQLPQHARHPRRRGQPRRQRQPSSAGRLCLTQHPRLLPGKGGTILPGLLVQQAGQGRSALLQLGQRGRPAHQQLRPDQGGAGLRQQIQRRRKKSVGALKSWLISRHCP